MQDGILLTKSMFHTLTSHHLIGFGKSSGDVDCYSSMWMIYNECEVWHFIMVPWEIGWICPL